MFFRTALLIASAGVMVAVAQPLSSQCTSTLLSVASATPCLDLTLLTPLISSSNSSSSIIPTVNTWLTGACSMPACTNAALQMVVTSITSGCASDLSSLGLTTNDISSLVTTVQAIYPTIRKIECLKDTSTNTLCVTEQLTGIQSVTGTLSLNNYIGLITHQMSGAMINIPKNLTCSNCSKAAYNLAAQAAPSASEESAYQNECGSSFTDGQMPSSIQETAIDATSSNGGASLSVNSLHVGVAMLVAVSSAFAMFA